ncbi:DUF6527 family protein [Novosphingobium sp. MD-1]|uniref:DUF6527 family protein n=1 Tax=Novosphingobium sp. MD-1 TaxID=1630648 RepID=UPI000F7EBB47|nr:DUF6527 family protein [Novosphingobium sp. MD-1]
MRFAYQAVERIPKQLAEGVVYHSEEFEVAALLCACGCGHRVMLLVPDSHQVYSESGMATIRPSISVCDARCKAHYVVTAGDVEMLPAFSEALAASVMRNQIARHANRETKRSTWTSWVPTTFAKVLRKIASLFGG